MGEFEREVEKDKERTVEQLISDVKRELFRLRERLMELGERVG